LPAEMGTASISAREGYVNLLRSGRRRPAAGGDGRRQLRYRAAFLDTGHFDALATTIVAQAGQSSRTVRQVLDAGSGTGHHLARIVSVMRGPVIGLGLDISKPAVREAARRWPMVAFAVADLWAEWPVRDAAVDLVVGIFAPKNFSEAGRVLRPGGWLAVAYPGPEHLIELRSRFGLLRQHEGNPGRYADMAARLIGRPSVTRLHNRTVLDPAATLAVILMGPNARHVDTSAFDVGARPRAVTFDISILFARKPEEKS
jgi:23S rRNA (guanine745-N1)-methyltransferase